MLVRHIKCCLGTSLKVHGALGFDQTSLLGCGGRGAGKGGGGFQPGYSIVKGWDIISCEAELCQVDIDVCSC